MLIKVNLYTEYFLEKSVITCTREIHANNVYICYMVILFLKLLIIQI